MERDLRGYQIPLPGTNRRPAKAWVLAAGVLIIALATIFTARQLGYQLPFGIA